MDLTERWDLFMKAIEIVVRVTFPDNFPTDFVLSEEPENAVTKALSDIGGEVDKLNRYVIGSWDSKN